MNEIVCVVDDDKYFNNLVTALIKQKAAECNRNVEVFSFPSGFECLKEQISPDLVFLDFYLSTNNDITQTGLDVLKKIKDKSPEAKVIFMSQVHDWANFKEELIEEGAQDFIKKDDHLSDNIEKILNKTFKDHANH